MQRPGPPFRISPGLQPDLIKNALSADYCGKMTARKEVDMRPESNSWRLVMYCLALGLFLPLLAPTAGWGQVLNLPGLITGTPVKQTSSDEAALAGKGFTPEVESGYRAKHPEMNFAEVDKVETFKVDPATLQAFIKEGDLKP
jgi:hypothetical protein